MSTPVCIANAVADALGVAEIDLPLTPAKLAALITMKPAPFDYCARRDACRGARGARRRGQRRQRDRGRAVAGAAAFDAHGAAEGGGRHHARRGPAGIAVEAMRSVSAPRCARPNCWRGRNSPRASRCSRRRCPGSGTGRRARAARCAARSRSPIRAPSCRSASSALGGERRSFVEARAPQRRGGKFLHRPDVDRAPR